MSRCDEAELLRRIAGFERALGLAAEPDLVDEDARLRRHVAARAAEQDEGAHRFAVRLGRERRARRAAVARVRSAWSCRRSWSCRGGGSRDRAPAQPAPIRLRNRAPAWRRGRRCPWRRPRSRARCFGDDADRRNPDCGKRGRTARRALPCAIRSASDGGLALVLGHGSIIGKRQQAGACQRQCPDQISDHAVPSFPAVSSSCTAA